MWPLHSLTRWICHDSLTPPSLPLRTSYNIFLSQAAHLPLWFNILLDSHINNQIIAIYLLLCTLQHLRTYWFYIDNNNIQTINWIMFVPNEKRIKLSQIPNIKHIKKHSTFGIHKTLYSWVKSERTMGKQVPVQGAAVGALLAEPPPWSWTASLGPEEQISQYQSCIVYNTSFMNFGKKLQ